MSNFQDSSWHVRFSQMGDASERKFEEWAEGRFERWGINRPENLHVPSLPPNVRAAPDYITNEGFVECMGVGRGQQLKLKLEKYAVLTWWNHVMPLRVWVWDSHKKRSCIIALADLDKIIQTPGVIEVAYFDDRKLAMAIPADIIFGG